MASHERSGLVLALALAASGCLPHFIDDTTHVTGARILAVRTEPAEAKEGDPVTLEALVAAPPGSDAVLPDWSLCIDRKPLSELGPVSTRCLSGPNPGPDIATVVEPGPPALAAVPENACQLFGPDRPEPKPGEPSGRPVDPDASGGFFQPVLAWLGDEPVLSGVRLGCGLIGAPPDVTKAYNQRYHPNQNPTLEPLELLRLDGSVQAFDGDEPLEVRAVEHVRLRVKWPACPEEGECGGSERYVVYDALSQTLLDRTESFVVSWYATAGSFAYPRTEQAFGGDGDGELPGTVNGWSAPASGTVEVWAVAHDDRGGQSWAHGTVVISP